MVAAKLTTVALYLTAFFETVVMNCIQPVNWEYCSKDLDVWLYPELVRGWEMITEGPCLYCEEKEKLDDPVQ